jgi:hypothetical protein
MSKPVLPAHPLRAQSGFPMTPRSSSPFAISCCFRAWSPPSPSIGRNRSLPPSKRCASSGRSESCCSGAPMRKILRRTTYRICTIANIVRYVTTPDDTHHLVCQGVQRARILDFLPGTPYLAARVLPIPEPTTDLAGDRGEIPQPATSGDRSYPTAAAGAARARDRV